MFSSSPLTPYTKVPQPPRPSWGGNLVEQSRQSVGEERGHPSLFLPALLRCADFKLLAALDGLLVLVLALLALHTQRDLLRGLGLRDARDGRRRLGLGSVSGGGEKQREPRVFAGLVGAGSLKTRALHGGRTTRTFL